MDTSHAPHTILIVEDHPATRKLLQDILGKEYQVLVVSDGQAALDLARENPAIDLILLDIIMQGLNGYEVCQKLKEDERTRDIPVIFLTVLEEDHDEARGFAAGVVDYIVKPISRLRLQARVENQLILRQKQRELEQKNRELQAALDQIKTLHGILPICSFCKHIRNDEDGCWQRLEEYVQNHSEAEFSHSLCPACMKKHYPEYCQEEELSMD
jgi:PleD family two-component response regulator